MGVQGRRRNRLQAGESWGPHGSEPECPLYHGEEHCAYGVGWGVTEDHCQSRAGRGVGTRWVERGDVKVEATLKPRWRSSEQGQACSTDLPAWG